MQNSNYKLKLQTQIRIRIRIQIQTVGCCKRKIEASFYTYLEILIIKYSLFTPT